jgi:integrase
MKNDTKAPQRFRLYRRGARWWVSICVGGLRHRLATGETNRRAAEARAAELVAPLLLEDKAKALEVVAALVRQSRTAAHDAAARASHHLLADAWKRWPLTTSRRGGMARTVAPRTAKLARDCWTLCARWAGGDGLETLEAITPALAAEYLDTLRQRASTRTHNVHLLALRAMYARANLPTGNPFAQAPRYREQSQHREPLTVAQVRELLATEPLGEMRVLLYLLAYTGLRLGDAATMRADRLDLADGTCRRVTTGKTGAAVEFPLHPALLAVLQDWRGSAAGQLLPGLAARYRREPASVSKLVKRSMARIGAVNNEARPESGRAISRYGAHCLRTTFATFCAEAGVSIQLVQDWLGHTSPEVTRIYARVASMAAKRRMVAGLPSF